MGNRKRSFALSLAATLLCAALLLGTTFAWFSDGASTGDTVITAGNLDVGLVGEDGASLEGGSLFAEGVPALWEPGVMAESVRFRVVNNGTLALRYGLSVGVTNEKKLGDKSLLDVIKVKVTSGDDPALPPFTRRRTRPTPTAPPRGTP